MRYSHQRETIKSIVYNTNSHPTAEWVFGKTKKIIPLIIILLAGVIEANSRVAFSRPGNMIRVPNVDSDMYKNLLAVNVSSEYLSSSQSSSAFSVNTLAKSDTMWNTLGALPLKVMLSRLLQ